MYLYGLKYQPLIRSPQTGVGVLHWDGRSRIMTGCRLALMGRLMPTMFAMSLPHGPAMLITQRVEISPLSVRTAWTLLDSILKPVTVVFLRISTPSRDAASAKLLAANAGSAYPPSD